MLNSSIYDYKFNILLERIPQFTVILGLFIWNFIMCEPIFSAPIFRI